MTRPGGGSSVGRARLGSPDLPKEKHMYASIRSYRLDDGNMGELMHRVDEEFAFVGTKQCLNPRPDGYPIEAPPHVGMLFKCSNRIPDARRKQRVAPLRI